MTEQLAVVACGKLVRCDINLIMVLLPLPDPAECGGTGFSECLCTETSYIS